MAMLRALAIVILITATLHILVSAEIHRAKSVYAKAGGVANHQRTRQTQSHPVDSDDHVPPHQHSFQSRGIESSPFPNKGDMIFGHAHETWVYAILSAVTVGLSGIFPLLVIPLETGKSLRNGGPNAARLNLLLSFAVGGLLGDVFLHLLPESWQHLNKANQGEDSHIRIGGWVLVGILSFLILEKIFSQETDTAEIKENGVLTNDQMSTEQISTKEILNKSENTCTTRQRNRNNNINDNKQNGIQSSLDKREETEHDKHKKSQNEQHIKIGGYLNLLANVIDNFTHGLAVAASYIVSTKVGILTTFAVLLHEIPHEVGDFAILLRSGFSRWKAAKAQLLTASSAMVGAFTALLSESAEAAGNRTAWVLPFTSGGFIYIALVTVVPELLKERNLKESIKQITCIISGILAMLLVTLVVD